MTGSIETLKHCANTFLGRASCGHDFLHCMRVANTADRIARADYPQSDRAVLIAAAVVHDLCRPWEAQTGESHFSEEALLIINVHLVKSGYDQRQRELILDIVRWHDVYDLEAIPSDSLTDELRIHQDADRLDAIGAIGIARAFAFGGANDCPMHIPGEQLDFHNCFVDSPHHRTSTVAHFYEKLLNLRDQMHTPTGRELAQIRHVRMEQFLADFFEEWQEQPQTISFNNVPREAI